MSIVMQWSFGRHDFPRKYVKQCFSLDKSQTFTDTAPFHELIAETTVIEAIRQGKQLRRPDNPECAGRGFLDSMWALHVACSSLEPPLRPQFSEIVVRTSALIAQYSPPVSDEDDTGLAG
jgi:hypothetical protein